MVKPQQGTWVVPNPQIPRTFGIMNIVFGAILLQGRQNMPISVRPLFGFAAIAFTLFGLLQMMGNQFGIDRDGFRVFVLCAVPRRQILLGKNLAFAPVALVISAILVIGVQIVCPMRLDHALGMIPSSSRCLSCTARWRTCSRSSRPTSSRPARSSRRT